MYAWDWSFWTSLVMSVAAYHATNRLVDSLKPMFIAANLYGIDLCKSSKQKIPEATGVISGCVFLITIFLFIPIPFGNVIFNVENFPHHEFVELLAALLSICCMLLLGFADDVLDLRWRHKLLLPSIASLPLLVVYYVNFNSTTIIVPLPLRQWFGNAVDIGVLYYLYMGMLAVFCTNAINILAGVNGLEVGQSVIIAASIAIFNGIELYREDQRAHQFSLYIILPYLATSLGLLKHNWYPARVFVGDTFCYLSGMTFAVVGILGHFSKTTLLFFIPQIFNFLYSLPQLFHLVPCPRHRMPTYSPKTDRLIASTFKIKLNECNRLGKLIVCVFRAFKLIDVEQVDDVLVINNFTIINLVLTYSGPMREENLTIALMLIQISCSILAFTIRYPLAAYFYDN